MTAPQYDIRRIEDVGRSRPWIVRRFIVEDLHRGARRPISPPVTWAGIGWARDVGEPLVIFGDCSNLALHRSKWAWRRYDLVTLAVAPVIDGRMSDDLWWIAECPECEGHGTAAWRVAHIGGDIIEADCHACYGTGWVQS